MPHQDRAQPNYPTTQPPSYPVPRYPSAANSEALVCIILKML